MFENPGGGTRPPAADAHVYSSGDSVAFFYYRSLTPASQQQTSTCILNGLMSSLHTASAEMSENKINAILN